MINRKTVFVAGHNGMVGSSLVRLLKEENCEIIVEDRKKLDLLNQSQVSEFFRNNKINEVYLAAAKVGGINANNSFPADFIYQNIMIQFNVINEAFKNGIKKLLFLGSSCIYPKKVAQPIKEESLLTSPLEPTNEPYAIAKIAGIKFCESLNRQFGKKLNIDYRSVMPSNLYGIGDNYHPENSHVIPGLIRKFHEAKVKNQSAVEIWGSGNPLREFLFVDDLARACILIMKQDKLYFDKIKCNYLNVGSGTEISIKDLAILIANIVDFKGKILFNTKMPDGTKRKIMDNNNIKKLGWSPRINLADGIKIAYNDFLKNLY